MTEGSPSTQGAAVERLRNEAHEAANRCIQCGYCLPVCPTFHSMGKETHSPRGRINLVKAAAEGKIRVLEDMSPALDLCLGCRACETACPVGVPYGEIFESARAAEAAAAEENGLRRGSLEKWALRHLFPHPRRMRAAGAAVAVGQWLRLDRFVLNLAPVRKRFPALSALGLSTPPVGLRHRIKAGKRIPPFGPKKQVVAFFQGCVMEAVMPRINRLTVDLLRHAGCEVVIPAGQTCCGALHAHQGQPETARSLARRNILAWEGVEADWLVNNAGGCGAMLRSYDHLLREDGDWAERAARLVSRSRDIGEMLEETGLPPPTRPPAGWVTYQESCHLRNVQKAGHAAEALLGRTAGDRFRPLPGAADCCASGGIYNLLHFEESMKILDEKMKSVGRTEAATVVTSNPGCHLQMRVGIKRAGMENRCRAVHLVEFLAECHGLDR